MATMQKTCHEPNQLDVTKTWEATVTEEKILKITRIVHSCVLVDLGGRQVLTDPWFSEKMGYHFGEEPGMSVESLPPLSGVVVSHDHHDHNDMKSFRRYSDNRVPIVCEGKAAARAKRAGFVNVTVLDTWEGATIGPLSVTAVPALHGVPEVGYVLQASGFTVYFAGDTLLIPELSDIADRFPNIDVALLPINGLKIFGDQVVMNPIEAAQLCEVLQPRVAIPTHYAFNGGGLADRLFLKYFDRQERLPHIFQDAMRRYAPQTRVEVLEPGQRMSINGQVHAPRRIA
jgi:L-ascorbate metabolism protein UlaG (beta-lactamase superfamily)